jgi:hypothetical protein
MLETDTERPRDRRFDRLAREVRRKLERTGRKIIRIDVAQDDRCIRYRRLRAAATVAGGTRLRARRLRTDPQRAGGIDPRDRPAARPDRIHVDHRHAHRISADLAFGTDERLPAADQGDVAARPADIDGDQVFDLRRATDLQATDDAGRRTRQEEPHRTPPGDGGGADAAARLHDLKRRFNAVLRQILLHALEITSDHRLDVGIERRHAGTLVLAEGRIDFAGQGDHDLRVAIGDDLARPPLMRRIEEREQVADGDRFDAFADQLIDRPDDRALIQRDENIAGRREALAHLLAQRTRCQEHRRLGLEDEVVHFVPHLAADLEHVLEARGREKADLRSLGLDHGVGGNRRAVHEADDLVRRHAPFPLHVVHRSLHAGAWIAPCRRDLDETHRPRAVATDDVGEGAADIDADLEFPCCFHHHHHQSGK